MPVLRVEHLDKKYRSKSGDVAAVSDVTFTVQKGEILGLLGPNGAGKTTTINMILGVLEPSSGEILIDGVSVAQERSRALSRTNFAAVYAPLPGNLTVAQNLEFFSRMYAVEDIQKRKSEALKEFDLEKFAHIRTGVLSSGEQSRVSLAKALINAPALLLLDEPTASLDPSIAKTIREHIVSYVRSQSDVGVLWTSHNMLEVTEVCDRVLFLSHGKILLAGDPKKLPQEHGKKDLEDLFIAVAREPLSLKNNL